MAKGSQDVPPKLFLGSYFFSSLLSFFFEIYFWLQSFHCFVCALVAVREGFSYDREEAPGTQATAPVPHGLSCSEAC